MMRLPRVRISIRGVMIAVAVLGTMFGVERAWRRYSYCQQVAAIYQTSLEGMVNWEKLIAVGPSELEPAAFVAQMTPLQKRSHDEFWYPSSAQRAMIHRRAQFYTREKQRFERASWRFWETVPNPRPDPAAL